MNITSKWTLIVWKMVPNHILAEMMQMDMNALMEMQKMITCIMENRIDKSRMAGNSLPCGNASRIETD